MKKKKQDLSLYAWSDTEGTETGIVTVCYIASVCPCRCGKVYYLGPPDPFTDAPPVWDHDPKWCRAPMPVEP